MHAQAVMYAIDEIRRLRDELASIELPQHEELSFRARLALLEDEATDLFRSFVPKRGH